MFRYSICKAALIAVSVVCVGDAIWLEPLVKADLEITSNVTAPLQPGDTAALTCRGVGLPLDTVTLQWSILKGSVEYSLYVAGRSPLTLEYHVTAGDARARLVCRAAYFSAARGRVHGWETYYIHAVGPLMYPEGTPVKPKKAIRRHVIRMWWTAPGGPGGPRRRAGDTVHVACRLAGFRYAVIDTRILKDGREMKLHESWQHGTGVGADLTLGADDAGAALRCRAYCTNATWHSYSIESNSVYVNLAD